MSNVLSEAIVTHGYRTAEFSIYAAIRTTKGHFAACEVAEAG